MGSEEPFEVVIPYLTLDVYAETPEDAKRLALASIMRALGDMVLVKTLSDKTFRIAKVNPYIKISLKAIPKGFTKELLMLAEKYGRKTSPEEVDFPEKPSQLFIVKRLLIGADEKTLYIGYKAGGDEDEQEGVHNSG